MSPLAAAALVLAGVGAGLTGSLAGPASLISYPALLVAGVPPVTANVTNTVAPVLDSAGSVTASRPELRGQGRRLRPLAPGHPGLRPSASPSVEWWPPPAASTLTRVATTDDPGARFLEALHGPVPEELAGADMLPTRLARAAVLALPVDGAGLSIHEGAGLRTPVGASDPSAAHAERLQFTHGDGPCLRAHDTGRAIAFDLADIERNWPDLHASLIGESPFAAVLSLPLPPPLGPTVVIDLYATEPVRLTRVPRDDVDAVLLCLAEELVRASDDTGSAPRWWDAPDARRRVAVWQATGMLSVALDMDVVAALATLRAHAFATGWVVDDVAADVVSGRLDPATLQE